MTELYRGQWWLPNEPDAKEQGTLFIEEDGNVRLELVGGFVTAEDEPTGAPGVSIPRFIDFYPLIHGSSGSEAFTLVMSQTVRANGGFSGRTTNHVLSAGRAFRGNVHLMDMNQVAFTGAELQLDNLLVWANMTTLGGELIFDDATGKRESHAQAKPIDPIEVRVGDLTYALHVHHRDFFFKWENSNTRVFSSLERAYVRVTTDEPVTIDVFDQASKKFQDLLTLAMNEPCGLDYAAYRAPADFNDDSDVPEYFRPEYNLTGHATQVYKADPDSFKDIPRDILFTATELPFQTSWPKWLELCERASVGIQMLLGTRYLNQGFIGTKLMTMCSAVEALHRGLYPGDLMSEEDFKAFVKRAKSPFKDEPGLRKLVGNALRNDPTYGERATELADKLDLAIVTFLVGSTEAWVKVLTYARNNLAHASGDKKLNTGMQMRLLVVTRTILLLVLGVCPRFG